MQKLISLDYEVFSGVHTGTVEKTILEPTEALIKLVDLYGIKLAFFVDIGFLLCLQEQSKTYPHLLKEYDAIRKQIESLYRAGHDIQLHIHPHWEDSYWDGVQWVIDARRFALHAFSEPEIREIVTRYTTALKNISGQENIFAYRAGGWVLQPFEKIKTALKENGIYLDSTVYKNGVSDSDTHQFDFRGAPETTFWHFEEDPLVPVENGYFMELPISSVTLHPSFYWKFAAIKKWGGGEHKGFGDGVTLPLGKTNTLQKLMYSSASVVSIDGYRASYLERAYQTYAKKRAEHFVIIGHPKMFSPYSLRKVEEFLHLTKGKDFVTYQAFARS